MCRELGAFEEIERIRCLVLWSWELANMVEVGECEK